MKHIYEEMRLNLQINSERQIKPIYFRFWSNIKSQAHNMSYDNVNGNVLNMRACTEKDYVAETKESPTKLIWITLTLHHELKLEELFLYAIYIYI